MKISHILNAKFLVSVNISDKYKCRYIEFLPETKSKLFGLIKARKCGFYSTDILGGAYYEIKELEEGKFSGIKLIVEDTSAYYRPCVEFRFTNGERFVNMGSGYKSTLMCVDNLGLVVRHDSKTTPTPEDVRHFLVGWNEQGTILIQADSLQDALIKFYDFPECKIGTKHRAWELIGTEKNPVIEYRGCQYIRFTEGGAMACGRYEEPQKGGHMTCIFDMNDEPPKDCPVDEQIEKRGWRSEVVQIGGVWVKRYSKNVREVEPLINGIIPR